MDDSRTDDQAASFGNSAFFSVYFIFLAAFDYGVNLVITVMMPLKRHFVVVFVECQIFKIAVEYSVFGKTTLI
jgi:hypothetical protein